MKPSLRFVLLFIALAALLPASALAFRPAPGDQLAQAVQSRALRFGDRNEQVAALQQLLLDRGFETGPVDGIFGPLTLGAVRAAQAHYKLEVDGLAGRLTVGALRNAVAAGPSKPTAAAAAKGDLVIYRAEDRPASSQQEQRRQAGLSATAPAPHVREGPAAARLIDAVRGPEAVPALADAAPAAPTGPAATMAPAAPTVPAAPTGGEVALTFNGLPDEAALASVLTSLQGRSMRATFFVPGEAAERRPDLVRQIHEAGHEIGSLGYTELDMRRTSPMTARALIRRTQLALSAVTGAEPAFFRPPLGRFDQNLTRLVEEEGLQLVLWSNVGVRAVPEVEPERLAEQLAGTLFPRAVLMLPLEKQEAVAAVEGLLERMEADGYQSRTLSELMSKPAGTGFDR